MTKLSPRFYNRKTRQVAKDLLGKFLIHQYRGQKYLGIITETEAYCGPQDKASHASRGRTKRTEIMFGPAGRAYIYLIYGMYYCFNIVTEKKDYPAAVLIRGVQAFKPIPAKQPLTPGLIPGLTALPLHQTNGPGKLCRYFWLDKTLNNISLSSTRLWVEDLGLKPAKIKKLPRVGIDYAGEYRDKPWRYVTEEYSDRAIER